MTDNSPLPRQQKIPLYRRVRSKVSRIRKSKIWLPHHSGYTPFIVLGQGRTGSNLLRTALQSSPQVAMENEIFNHKQPDIGQDFDSIMNNLLRRYPITIKAVGCKIFYTHLTDHEWSKFRQRADFKIIHLTRRNRLRVAASLEIAQKTEQWIEKRQGIKPPLEERRIRLNMTSLVAQFRRNEAIENKARQRFRDRPVLEVCYEDMVADTDTVVSEIIDFIGAKEWNKELINLRKQNPEPLSELIINFDELKGSFANTPWRAYFDEGS